MPPTASSDANEISEQHDGDRRCARLVAALDVVEDEHRRDLGLVGQVARR